MQANTQKLGLSTLKLLVSQQVMLMTFWRESTLTAMDLAGMTPLFIAIPDQDRLRGGDK